MSHTLVLDLVTQEKRLFEEEVKQLTVETVEGEITILPGHIPLLTKLSEGLLRYLDPKGREHIVAIFGGFLELNGSGRVTVLADAAVRAEDIDQARAEKAKKEAEESLKNKTREVEFALAEAALKRTYLELKAVRAKPRHAQN